MEVKVRNARKEGYYLELRKEAGSIIMHSKYAPREEAGKWFKEWKKTGEGKQLIVLGGGMGYFPAELEAHGYECVVLELLPEFEPPEDSPASRFQKEEKHFFISSGKELEKTLKKLENNFLQNARPIIHPYYQELYPERTKKIHEQLILDARHQLRERQTRRKFFWLWFDNLLKNLPELDEMQALTSLKNSYAGKPAIIIGAGPSTGKALGWLKKFQNKFLIIAADTSVKILVKAGIKADYVLSTDPQEGNSKYISGIEEKINLIGSWSARPEYFQWAKTQFRFPTFISHETTGKDPVFPFAAWLSNFVEGIVSLQSGGSVTTTALDFAQYLGTQPIGIVGVDHLFTYHRAVSRGAHWEEEQLKNLNRFRSLPGTHLNSFLGSGKYSHKRVSLVNSRENRKFYTTDEYQKQNAWFEEAAGILPHNCLDFRDDGLAMRNWTVINDPAEYWAKNEKISPPKNVDISPAPIKVNWSQMATEGQKLLDLFAQKKSTLTQKLIRLDDSLPEIIRRLYEPFQKSEGLGKRNQNSLATGFIEKIKSRLKKVIKIANQKTGN